MESHTKNTSISILRERYTDDPLNRCAGEVVGTWTDETVSVKDVISFLDMTELTSVDVQDHAFLPLRGTTRVLFSSGPVLPFVL